jgi:hypothetical protein
MINALARVKAFLDARSQRHDVLGIDIIAIQQTDIPLPLTTNDLRLILQEYARMEQNCR